MRRFERMPQALHRRTPLLPSAKPRRHLGVSVAPHWWHFLPSLLSIEDAEEEEEEEEEECVVEVEEGEGGGDKVEQVATILLLTRAEGETDRG